jgi:transcriptional regulator with XRE-family HTH domain
MTRKELAKLINVSVHTLGNWEREKPELIKLINLGLHSKKRIKTLEEDLKFLKEIKSYSKLQIPKEI